jgi:hypothetical protein
VGSLQVVVWLLESIVQDLVKCRRLLVPYLTSKVLFWKLDFGVLLRCRSISLRVVNHHQELSLRIELLHRDRAVVNSRVAIRWAILALQKPCAISSRYLDSSLLTNRFLNVLLHNFISLVQFGLKIWGFSGQRNFSDIPCYRAVILSYRNYIQILAVDI